ncbi:ATP-dependent helicase [Caldilinea sp.]|uniref:ATP-dependent helicase n=2 Tax=Caldilinea sp. TaxID=2293560 RepID=UPI0021DB97DF|nr:ATP-dependent helicase [Caldilinea sp.]GIV69942.1 MAG: DNA helicase [Caldilinea sp.]
MPDVEQLWQLVGFQPNQAQRAAILHADGPLYLPAGPGSGKTRVLLWRTLNLIVFHGVPPEAIFLSTFTEKAARQLKEGLRALLGLASNFTGRPYDISQMYVGTVHSLCQRLIMDRRFYRERQRRRPPTLLDDLGQYLYLYRPSRWEKLACQAGFDGDAASQINALFGHNSGSRHHAVTHALALFNRLSEECLTPEQVTAVADDPVLIALARMYAVYLSSLRRPGQAGMTDFALLQQEALNVLNGHDGAAHVFQHVIVDEYQDTNTIQERLFFRLAAGSRNLCVVGDDDQALYRFRGATVENFVQFPERCKTAFGVEPTTIPLDTNYRSRRHIVQFYTEFIGRCDWRNPRGGHFRVTSKQIRAASADAGVAVVASTPAEPDVVAVEVADLVRRLLNAGRVENPNQIAFLFPSLKSPMVARMKAALEAQGLRVYAPRAGTFLEVPEAVAMFGLYLRIFGRPERGDFGGEEYRAYHDWLDNAEDMAEGLCKTDRRLDAYVRDRQAEIERAVSDHDVLSQVCQRQGWQQDAPYEPRRMKRDLYDAPRLSDVAKRKLGSPYFERVIERRIAEGRPYSLSYILSSMTALDWGVLDLFYRLCGFDHFRAMFDLAECGEDEGPICNLSLISQYLARFMDEYGAILTAPLLRDNGLARLLFGSYLFALYRRGESEYEDAEDPFPRGRIPFLTIHQAKGLEFPVVVLGNPRKDTNRGPQPVERLVHPLLDRKGEPLDRMAEFDAMRLFYVALSRAKNLLVIAHPKGRGQRINEPFRQLLDRSFPRIPQLDVNSLPAARLEEQDTPHTYSYTGDYLFYQRCPRQYMIFRKYDFVPSRSQTMMFGALVHRTLDDLHQLLIARRSQTP